MKKASRLSLLGERRAMTKLGFTGTAKGMTRAQKAVFRALILQPALGAFDEFHHGDCVGADEESHRFIRENKPAVWIVGHPPIIDKFRAFTKCDEWRPLRGYIPRNHKIVDETDRLLATPRGFKEELRSGTWATLRYARKLERELLIIWPDGTTAGGWT